jgi:hypothetical protein
MCERVGCEACRDGIAWLNTVQRNGHEEPLIALRAIFVPSNGKNAQGFLRDHCPGDDLVQQKAQKDQPVGN